MTAQQIHTQAIILDAHNDSLALKLSKADPLDFGPANDAYHVDLPRMEKAGLTAFFSYVGARDLAVSLQLWDAVHWHLDTYPDDFTLAGTAADVRQAKAAGKIAFIGQLESCACLHQSLRVLSLQHRLGLRVANLTHGEGQAEHEDSLQGDKSPFDYTDTTAREAARVEMKGLTDFGRELIGACNDTGLLVDLAHANDRTFYDALELSHRPCVFSHGSVFALCPHWRALTDDQIRALAATGGVMGVAFYRKFIHPEDPTLERLLDQVEHVINLVGPDHIGFGSDFDGLPEDSVPIPAHMGVLEEFTDGLIRRGLDEETILKILGGNFLRVFEEACG
jgi:membrane dipeptidase